MIHSGKLDTHFCGEWKNLPRRLKPRLGFDLVKAGVIDPTKVTRYALQNAASISGLMLTTEALVAEMAEKEKSASQRTDY